MSRPAGQITTSQAVAGLAVVVIAVAGLVQLTDWLLLPTEEVPEFDAPPSFEDCPEVHELPPVRPIPVTSTDLIGCPKVFDGLLVSYRGEVIESVLQRGDRAWVLLNDDPYALHAGPLAAHRTALGGNSGMPVSLPVELAEQIAYPGSHRARGDLVEVTAEFRRADPQDGGGPALRAAEGQIVRAGTLLTHAVSVRRLTVAGALVLITAALLAAAMRRRRLFLRGA